MIHDSHGFWLADAGLASVVAERPPVGRQKAQVVVVGGGFTGMWTAWFLSRQVGPDDVVLLDIGLCGTGPSGRNAGFCHGLAEEAEWVADRFGDAAAKSLVDATTSDALGIGQWARESGLDVGFRQAGELIVSCSDTQERERDTLPDVAARIGLEGGFCHLTSEEVRARCDSPVFQSAVHVEEVATVHPGRLALGLRGKLIESGVRIHENARALSLDARGTGATVRTASASFDADSAVIACGIRSAGWRGLRRELTMTSSHMVVTEPVPDLLEALGWTGGEAIVDRRVLVHYFRTTEDGRIAFGWGGGRVGFGSEPTERESVDRGLSGRVTADMMRFFPMLEGRRIEHAWGGPIDAATGHLPSVRQLRGGRVHAAFGFTGNGVGPTRSCGRVLASLALDPSADLGPYAPLVVDEPVRVPPEPFRWIGGNAIMKGLDRLERAGEAGHQAGPVTRAIAAIPSLMGYRIGR